MELLRFDLIDLLLIIEIIKLEVFLGFNEIINSDSHDKLLIKS